MINIFGPSRKKCIRLSEYDYALPGSYYVTICAQDRICLFGNVANESMFLSSIGEMIQKAWLDLPRYDSRVRLDESIVMPNHLHGIVVIDRTESPITSLWADTQLRAGTRPAPTVSLNRISLPDVIRMFKSLTTVQYIRGMEQDNWPEFRKRLWQRGYYEHIIRNDADLNRIRKYIRNNPQNWDADPENPDL